LKLGIGLPGYLGTLVDAGFVLDWARRADEAGFAALAAHDRPDHDTWDPLTTLAAVAPITRNARLITTTLLLPARDAGLVAKQAATIDVISGGRRNHRRPPSSRSPACSSTSAPSHASSLHPDTTGT
jgi:alkanesulfonate monooxygenase SsuD/methylene tetrahydromethanopterin reductase-like flavin-dependent oxidoreductase (luciferase family)